MDAATDVLRDAERGCKSVDGASRVCKKGEFLHVQGGTDSQDVICRMLANPRGENSH